MATEETRTSPAQSGNGFLGFCTRHAKKFIVAAVLIAGAALVASVAIWSVYKDYDKDPLNKTIAIVNGEKITQRDLNTAVYGLGFVGTVEEPGEAPVEVKKQLFEQLIEYKILQKRASDFGIKLTDKEVSDKALSINADYSKLEGTNKAILENNAKLELLRAKVQEKVISWSEGKFVLIRYDLHYYDVPTGISEKERTALVPQDKAAAKVLIDKIYNDVTSGKITFDAGMELANNDSRLGKDAWKPFTMTWSQAFTKKDSIDRGYPTSSSEFWDKVNSTEIGKVSKPLTVNVTLSGDTIVGKNNSQVEGMYLIVSREKGLNGEASNYTGWLTNQENNLKVTRYSYE